MMNDDIVGIYIFSDVTLIQDCWLCRYSGEEKNTAAVSSTQTNKDGHCPGMRIFAIFYVLTPRYFNTRFGQIQSKTQISFMGLKSKSVGSSVLIFSSHRFDDPKVSSIAFLTKKAQLIASDVDDSTDDDYSPKTKRLV